MEPVNPQPLPLRARPRRTKTRRRAERTGRRQPPRRWQPTTGSQPRPDVQEGRPPTAPTRTAEAQARGQRAEHQSARPSAVLAPSRVQRRGVEARRVVAPCVGARSVSDEPGERPERRVSAARYPVTNYLDTDGLSLVVLSCGVQEGRPFFFSRHFCPNLPRFGKLDAQTRRGIPATGDAKRRRSSRDPRDAGRRVRGGGFRLGRRDEEETGRTDFPAGIQRLAHRRSGQDFRGRLRRREVGACGKAAAPSVLVGLLPRQFRKGARCGFATLTAGGSGNLRHFPPLAFVPHTRAGAARRLPRFRIRLLE